MKIQLDQRVQLIKLSENKALTRTFRVGMKGTITALNTPIPGYHNVKWDTGIETDSRADTIAPL